MTESIRISVSGLGQGTDAPVLEDFLEQVRDFFSIFRGVEEIVVGDDGTQVVWRITDASRNSPLRLTVTAFPARPDSHVEIVTNQVKRATLDGLRQLTAGQQRPQMFNDNVLQVADRFVRRVASGGGRIEIDNQDGAAPLILSPREARQASENIRVALEPPPVRTYRELSTIEGTIKRVGKDGFGHPIIWLERRLDGAEIKCFLEGDALHVVEAGTVDDVVFRDRKAELVGRLDYRSLGRISEAFIHTIRFSPDPLGLPSFMELEDADFTGGLTSEDYLERLRSGGQS